MQPVGIFFVNSMDRMYKFVVFVGVLKSVNHQLRQCNTPKFIILHSVIQMSYYQQLIVQ